MGVPLEKLTPTDLRAFAEFTPVGRIKIWITDTSGEDEDPYPEFGLFDVIWDGVVDHIDGDGVITDDCRSCLEILSHHISDILDGTRREELIAARLRSLED